MTRNIIGHISWLFTMDSTGRRKLTGLPERFVQVIGFVFAIVFVYSAMNGAIVYLGPRTLTPLSIKFPLLSLYSDHIIIPLFIFFTSALVFLLYPAKKGNSPTDRPSVLDWIWCLLALAVMLDYSYFFELRGDLEGEPARWNDILFSAFATIMALEVCRRVLGNILPTIASLFILYDAAGSWIPISFLAHKGQPFGEVLFMFYSQYGIYGVIARVFAYIVVLFIVFGTFIQYTKVGEVFMDLAFALVGRSRGGAAKATVVSSSMVGSVLGSGAANIAITGTFTIPLMKKGGYKPEYAAAVEAVASIGGHLMPPVMGSAVFLMAALTETPYTHIILVAFVPALLYYLAVFASAHFYACRHGLRGLPEEDIPEVWTVLRKDGYLLLPIVVLVALLVAQFSPFYAAFWSLMSAIVCFSVRQEQRFVLQLLGGVIVVSLIWPGGFLFCLLAAIGVALLHERSRAFLGGIAEIFSKGAVNALTVGAVAGVMGIVLSAVSHSGLGIKFPALILSYSFGYFWLALLLTAVASYFLGMGMTIGASYLLIVLLAGPALQDFGISMLTAHLIVYWLSQDSSLTPPFALGAFIASGIAGSDPMRTGFTALKIAKPLYLVPVMMAYAPAFLMSPGTLWFDTAVTWLSVALAFIASSAALEGFFLRTLTLLDRGVLIIAAILMMWYSPLATPALYWTKVAGLGLLAASALIQWQRPEEVFESPIASEAIT